MISPPPFNSGSTGIGGATGGSNGNGNNGGSAVVVGGGGTNGGGNGSSGGSGSGGGGGSGKGHVKSASVSSPGPSADGTAIALTADPLRQRYWKFFLFHREKKTIEHFVNKKKKFKKIKIEHFCFEFIQFHLWFDV